MMGPRGEFKVKNATYYVCIYFFGIFVLFFIKKLCFYIILISWLSNKFSQQDVNLSESRIGDKKCSVGLYA